MHGTRISSTDREGVPVIRASEVGQYLYCARSWWLHRVHGYAPRNIEEIKKGILRHEAHGRAVFVYRAVRWLAYILFAAAALVGLQILYLAFAGGEIGPIP